MADANINDDATNSVVPKYETAEELNMLIMQCRIVLAVERDKLEIMLCDFSGHVDDPYEAVQLLRDAIKAFDKLV